MAELTRRGALLGGAGVVGALGVAATTRVAGTTTSGLGTAPADVLTRVAGAAVAGATAATLVETLRRSDFEPGVGLGFTARAGRAFALRLVEIVDVAGTADPEHSFNLIFESSGTNGPAEGLYRLSSDATPHRTLMLSPVDRPTAGAARSFQALVNAPA
ncbi:DUF6916 family protein [Curtobacterium sp. RRHDQ10]|uniref:DUF6916 family protein n=1 Tax=Curtobacterium phyllosphaerae TaxID=3413379 RepID=UPI003BF25B98